jgi:hypothetical protein
VSTITPTSTSSSISTPFGYAGEYTDDGTGFLYLRARYYDPATRSKSSRWRAIRSSADGVAGDGRIPALAYPRAG